MDWIYDLFTVDMVKELLYYVEIFFIIYLIGYSTFLFCSVVAGGNQLFENMKKKQLQNEIHHDFYVPVSIIIPAYNEEVTIIETIKSLMHLDYRLYEVIVVNDGSKDSTGALVAQTFDLHQVMRPIRCQVPCQDAVSIYEGTLKKDIAITLINKKNGGKADAINMGINAALFPYFICMDADSILQYDSLTHIASPVLENQNVVAVGSMIRVSNDSIFRNGKAVEMHLPKKLVPALQTLEYERSFLASRILLDKFNANLIVSGAFGLFKKDAVIQVGGYQVNSIGEDMELIMKLHSYYSSNHLPYVIKYAYDAVCWTQAPERLRDLLKQRKRWHIGLIQSMGSHRMFLKPSYLYYLFYELLSPLIELTGLLLVPLAAAFGLLDPWYMAALFLTYAFFGSILTVTSFATRNFLSDAKVSFGDIVKAILLCIPENIFLRFILAWTRLAAILFYRGKKTKWGEIKRYQIDYDQKEPTTQSAATKK